jgi:cobalt ECF transporter T component CbiQ
LGAFILCAVATHRLWVLFALFVLTIPLAAFSNIPIRLLFTRVWLSVLAFTGLIAFPALFFIPGQPLFRLPLLGWTATAQGLTSAVFLTLRAETAATFSLLLVLSTQWNRLLRGLRFLHAPIVLVVIVETTYRFVFVLLQTTSNMLESRSTRLVGRLEGRDQRRFAAATVGVLLDKTLQFSTDVQGAMQARGFRGEPMLLDDLRMDRHDWLQLSAFLGVAAVALWLGR